MISKHRSNKKTPRLPPGFNLESVCLMSLANVSLFERVFDRLGSVFLLGLGLTAAAAVAVLGA